MSLFEEFSTDPADAGEVLTYEQFRAAFEALREREERRLAEMSRIPVLTATEVAARATGGTYTPTEAFNLLWSRVSPDQHDVDHDEAWAQMDEIDRIIGEAASRG